MSDNPMRIQSVEGIAARTVVARLLPGTDVLPGIEECCRKHGIKQGVVSCSVGAFKQATFVIPVPQEGAKIGIVYGEPVVLTGPIEFLGGQGIICQSEEDKYLIHFHGSACDKDLRVWGGHFTNGNIVLATLDLVIQEIGGVNMMRRFDEETGFVQFSPEPLEV
ncbi:PPC domain-containing DNA-binding protein [uncultured Anaeromusa sp.]|uniref:PPC domain-containing DNA-binding protein n=1 Tax=uncultured Anaeromusa sp. TaxID=673273 RepID=UPI0029C8DBC0|nr:PPC domain-containing DNA-binding protein [uncultured Anaeromusa sp.]